jgi:hypothetical protein
MSKKRLRDILDVNFESGMISLAFNSYKWSKRIQPFSNLKKNRSSVIPQ